jgi:hypothetical protein
MKLALVGLVSVVVDGRQGGCVSPVANPRQMSIRPESAWFPTAAGHTTNVASQTRTVCNVEAMVPRVHVVLKWTGPFIGLFMVITGPEMWIIAL